MRYSLDILAKERPFVNIEVDKDRVLIGAYENGKITRKLFYMNKKQLELLINGLKAAVNLFEN